MSNTEAYCLTEYDGDGRQNAQEIPIADAEAELAQEYREKLMDEVSESSDALMERYLEGDEISHEEIVTALKDGTNHGGLFPVTCGVATRNLATNRLLDEFAKLAREVLSGIQAVFMTKAPVIIYPGSGTGAWGRFTPV